MINYTNKKKGISFRTAYQVRDLSFYNLKYTNCVKYVDCLNVKSEVYVTIRPRLLICEFFSQFIILCHPNIRHRIVQVSSNDVK